MARLWKIRIYSAGNPKRASYELVVKWVADAWEKVATDELIVQGFEQCGYINWKYRINKLNTK